MKKMKVTKKRALKAIAELVEIISVAAGFNEPNATAVRDIVSFLRGPDNEDAHIKSETTAKVRSVIGIEEMSGWVINPRPIDLSYTPLGQHHHNTHWLTAKAALRTLGFFIK
jgi:hypothetical protein